MDQKCIVKTDSGQLSENILKDIDSYLGLPLGLFSRRMGFVAKGRGGGFVWIDKLGLCKDLLTVHVPSHNASHFSHMLTQLCIVNSGSLRGYSFTFVYIPPP